MLRYLQFKPFRGHWNLWSLLNFEHDTIQVIFIWFFYIYFLFFYFVFFVKSETYLKPSRTSVNYFRKKAPSWMFDWVLNTPLHVSLSHSSIKRKKSILFFQKDKSVPSFLFIIRFSMFMRDKPILDLLCESQKILREFQHIRTWFLPISSLYSFF